jgi:transcriptional regulator with XRE-family HTH domain
MTRTRNKMSFRDIYNDHTKEAFVNRVAKITRKSPQTVRAWVQQKRTPDSLTKAVLAKEFGIKEEDLFPDDKARG